MEDMLTLNYNDCRYILINGNSLDFLQKIPAESIDTIITDPPYCVGISSNGYKSTIQENCLITPFFEKLFSEFKRVVKKTAALYIHTDWRTYPFLYPEISKFFRVRNVIVWDYDRMKTGNFYRFSYELIIFATTDDATRTFSRCEKDLWHMKGDLNPFGKKLHPAQKPCDLIEKMIANSSLEGDTILDTFMGSGTTGIACLNTGRNFIGIEINKNFYDIAKNRLSVAVKEKASTC